MIGGMGKVIQLASLAPETADAYMERTTFNSQLTNQLVAADRRDNLYEPVEHDGGERGRTWTGRTKESSLYTWAALHPERATLALAGLTLAAAGLRSMGRARERAAHPVAGDGTVRSLPDVIPEGRAELAPPLTAPGTSFPPPSA